MKKKYIAAVLGCAHIAVRSLIPELFRSPRFKLAAVASRDRAKARAAAEPYPGVSCGTYDEIIRDGSIDLVYIPLPNSMHYEWIMKALENGKHVLCEKSLVTEYSQLEEITAFACAQRLLVAENFQFRFHSQHRWTLDSLAAGIIGEIRLFRSSFGIPPLPAGNIRYSKDLGGGSLLDNGAYPLKAMQFILGGYDFTMKAATLRYGESGVDISGAMYLDCPEGIAAELAFGMDNFYQCNYEIWGSTGKITAARAFTAPPGLKPRIVFETADGVEDMEMPADNHFANMLLHIAECLDNGNFEDEYAQNLRQAAYIKRALELAQRPEAFAL
ncbi:MAG: Gfo/Idh/MocA family oxidoreductase [Spirochaetaceae bacterium]|jgi:predicted dehydrogenase|nr:Gfo/Idh/MocA family oxidoreductase [Spirochaetaceae bacterium]